jgi:hypothetical protein
MWTVSASEKISSLLVVWKLSGVEGRLRRRFWSVAVRTWASDNLSLSAEMRQRAGWRCKGRLRLDPGFVTTIGALVDPFGRAVSSRGGWRMVL